MHNLDVFSFLAGVVTLWLAEGIGHLSAFIFEKLQNRRKKSNENSNSL